MSFLTEVDRSSHPIVEKQIAQHIIGQKNVKAMIKQPLPAPSESNHLQFEGYWIRTGCKEPRVPKDYILTPSVRANLRDLSRVVCAGYDIMKFVFYKKQESIPVGCIPPACQPSVLQWPPDVSTMGGQDWVGPPCLMSRGWGWRGSPMSDVPGGESCTLRSNVPWVMVTWGPPFPRWTDGHE